MWSSSLAVLPTVAELPDVAAKIGIELRNQYVVGYSPAKYDARWEIPENLRQIDSTARTSAVTRILENRLFCTDAMIWP